MINRKIAASGLSILTALSLMTGATFAFFSDVGTSSANTFSTGTLDMKLTDDNESSVDSVSTTWGITGGMPGSTFTNDLSIKNIGTVDADHVELQFVNGAITEGAGPGAVATIPLTSVIEITSFLWDDDGDGTPTVDLLAGVSDTNTNLIKDLDDLANQLADDFDNLAFSGTDSNNHVLRIAGRFSPTLTVNQHQGDSVTTTLNVTMNQDSSQ